MKKAVLVIRVSDPKQERDGLSLDNQEAAVRQYAKDKGFEIAREFRFQETADLKIRNKFLEVIRFIKSRKDVEVLVGYRVDRLTRNFRDHVAMDELRTEHGKELHFVHDRLVIGGRTVGLDIQQWDTQVYLAKMYINRLKADAEITAKFKLDRGEITGKAPFGYLNRVDASGKSSVVLNRRLAPVVTRIFALYCSGAHTMDSTRAAILREYGIGLSKGRIDHILNNPFYIGQMRFRGKLYPHVYEHLVSEATFQRVCERKQSYHKKSFKFAGLPFAYRGLITCAECGCSVTPERKVKKGGTYIYYHCTQYKGKHPMAWLPEGLLTEQFQAILDGLRLQEEVFQQVIETLWESHGSSENRTQEAQTQLKASISKYERRIEQMYEDKLDGQITSEYFESQRDRCKGLQKELERKLSQLESAPEPFSATARKLLRVCQQLGKLFRSSEADEKRRLLNLLLQNCQLKEKTLLWELKKPFQTVFSCSNSLIWGPSVDEIINQLTESEVDFDELAELEELCKNPNENEELLAAA